MGFFEMLAWEHPCGEAKKRRASRLMLGVSSAVFRSLSSDHHSPLVVKRTPTSRRLPREDPPMEEKTKA